MSTKKIQILESLVPPVTWDNLKNKPFGKTGTFITWDGTPTSSYVEVEEIYGTLYKVAGVVPTIYNSIFDVVSDEDGSSMNGEMPTNDMYGTVDGQYEHCMYVWNIQTTEPITVDLSEFTDSTNPITITFPDTGLYFYSGGGYHVSKLLSNDYGTVKLSEEYLPDYTSKFAEKEHIHSEYIKSEKQLGEKTIVWDGATHEEEPITVNIPAVGGDASYYKIPNVDIFDEGIEVISVIIKGIGEMSTLIQSYENAVVITGKDIEPTLPFIVSVNADNTTVSITDLPSITFPTTGVYFVYIMSIDMRIESFSAKLPTDKISKSYLPNDTAIMGSDIPVPTIADDGKILQIENGKWIAKKLKTTESGAVIAWEDISNKPFEETGTCITWDGIPTSVSVELSDVGAILYKVSETVPTIYDSVVEFISEGSIEAMSVNDMYATSEGQYEHCLYVWNIMTTESITVDLSMFDIPDPVTLTFPETGLYFISAGTIAYTTALKGPDYNLVKIPEKFMPYDYLKSTDKGVVGGVATLDYSGKLTYSQLPYHSHNDSYYTKSEIDSKYYTKNYIDNNYYQKDYITSVYYSKSDIDNNYYTKTQIGSNYYTKSNIDSNYYNKTEIDNNHYDKTEIDNKLADISSQTALPTITDDDNGKFLKISNGQIVYEALLSAEGVSF